MKTRVKENSAAILFAVAGCISILAVITICIFLFAASFPAAMKIGIMNFLTGKQWKPDQNIFGIFPMIIGSIYVTAGALIIGVPIGILCAVFITNFASPKIAHYLNPAIELLAGIPSVVYGLFGLTVIVPIIRNVFGGTGSSMLAASILLGIMILPTIISVSTASLEAVPKHYYEGALALGASHEQSVFFTVLPAAKSGITAGIILGTGRAIGETMAVIMVAGNQARLPNGLLKGVRTLTANIAIEMGYSAGLHREALIATGAVLFIFILIINTLFSILKNKKQGA